MKGVEMFYALLSGAIMMACWVSAFFFLRFWKMSQDRLFAMFSLAFALMGVERLILGLNAHPSEANPMTYLIRLSTFIIILIAIADKNRKTGTP